MEIHLGRDVLFPRLDIGGIHRHLLFFISILVGESGKAVSELMDDDRPEVPVMGHREVVAVEDASAAIF